MVSSGIEPLIPALLARCLNQLGQETTSDNLAGKYKTGIPVVMLKADYWVKSKDETYPASVTN
ncbi:hypothetical protein ACU8KH_04467 [Lachancea thermotolerans]